MNEIKLDIVPYLNMLASVGYETLEFIISDIEEEERVTVENFGYLLVDFSNYFLPLIENEEQNLLANKILIELLVIELITDNLENSYKAVMYRDDELKYGSELKLKPTLSENDRKYLEFTEEYFDYLFYIELKQYSIPVEEKDVVGIISKNIELIKNLDRYILELTNNNIGIITSWIGKNGLLMWREY